MSGQALATCVLKDVGCNVGRAAALLSREQENLADLNFAPVNERWESRGLATILTSR